MDARLEKIIQDGKQEHADRIAADKQALKDWVDTKLLEDIKESTARGI